MWLYVNAFEKFLTWAERIIQASGCHYVIVLIRGSLEVKRQHFIRLELRVSWLLTGHKHKKLARFILDEIAAGTEKNMTRGLELFILCLLLLGLGWQICTDDLFFVLGFQDTTILSVLIFQIIDQEE